MSFRFRRSKSKNDKLTAAGGGAAPAGGEEIPRQPPLARKPVRNAFAAADDADDADPDADGAGGAGGAASSTTSNAENVQPENLSVEPAAAAAARAPMRTVKPSELVSGSRMEPDGSAPALMSGDGVYKGKLCAVALYSTKLEWTMAKGGKKHSLQIIDMYGVHYNKAKNAPVVVYSLVHKRNSRKRERKDVMLTFATVAESQRWHQAIRALVAGGHSVDQDVQQRVIYFVVEHNFDKKMAGAVFDRTIYPMLLCADYINAKARYVVRAGDGVNLAYHIDIKTCYGLVVVGGDGLFAEVIQGFCRRRDWEDAFSSLAVGIIPAGYSNVAAQSLISTDPIDATFQILKCRTTRVPLHSIFRNRRFPMGLETPDVTMRIKDAKMEINLNVLSLPENDPDHLIFFDKNAGTGRGNFYVDEENDDEWKVLQV